MPMVIDLGIDYTNQADIILI